MPPDEPGIAPVIRLPLKRRPTLEQEAHREQLLHARLHARKLRRLKLKVALAGAALLGLLGAGLSMAVDSTDIEGGPVAEEEDSPSEEGPFGRPSVESDDTAAGSAWFTTEGAQRR
jgi:hypothetical protein